MMVLARTFFTACIFVAAVSGARAATLFHDLYVTINPTSGSLHVEDRITVEGRDTLRLDLRADMVIEHVLVDDAPITFDTSKRPLRVPLPTQARHKVTVRYHGTPVGQGLFIDERGAYLPAGSGWMAGYRERQFDFRLRVSVGSPYRVVATGEVESLGSDNGSVFTATRVLDPPSIFAGRFAVDEIRRGNVRIMTWLPKASASLSRRYLDNAARYLDVLQARIGVYPHRSFHIVAGPLPVGLGFAGLTYISQRILHLPFMQTRSLAHEIAHSWWGNAVGVDYRTGNWAEGLTTYMADYALARTTSEAKGKEMRLGWLRDYMALPAEADVAVRSFRSKTHDAAQVIGYNKAAFIFHMLEQELTRPIFDAGLRHFWTTEQGRVAGWEQLEAAFESASGRELGWFFDQWVDASGAPDLSLVAPRVVADGTRYRLEFKLVQTGPVYRLKLQASVVTDHGTQWLPVELADRVTRLSFDLEAPARRLTIDPAHDVFRRLAPGESTPIFRDVSLDSNTAVVVAAGPDPNVERVAVQLAERLLRRQVKLDSSLEPGPLLAVGLSGPLAAVLRAAGLKAPDPAITAAGSARAWTTRREDGSTVMVVSADNSAALEGLLRPLPHYRRYGYVVFDGPRAGLRGVWPSTGSALDHRFD